MNERDLFQYDRQLNLPNATAVLVLGIISIPTCLCYGFIGLTCGIIALVLAKKDTQLYNSAPEMYRVGSYNNLKGGRVCAIIGTVLSGMYLLYVIFMIIMFGTIALNNPGQFMRTH